MEPAPLTVGQMRARIWSEVIHGASGTVLGYTSGENWGLFDPTACRREALKAVDGLLKESRRAAPYPG